MNMDNPLTPRLKQALWRHPEWWIYTVSVMAWAAMVLHVDPTGVSFNSTHQHHHSTTLGAMSWMPETSRWMLMIVAMMFPLIANSAQNVAARSLWFRRQRAIAGFVFGYLCVWLIVGIAVSLAISYFKTQSWVGPKSVVGLAFFTAALWQGIPIKRRAFLSCHRTRPIAPEGARADWDCVRYGWMIGGSCLLNCWAWMLFCTLTGHNLVAMLFAAFVGMAERYPLRRIKFPAPFTSSFMPVR